MTPSLLPIRVNTNIFSSTHASDPPLCVAIPFCHPYISSSWRGMFYKFYDVPVISITMDCNFLDFSPYMYRPYRDFWIVHPFNILTRQYSPYPIYPLKYECFFLSSLIYYLGTFHTVTAYTASIKRVVKPACAGLHHILFLCASY